MIATLSRLRVLVALVFKGSRRRSAIGVALGMTELAVIPLTALALREAVDAVVKGDATTTLLVAAGLAVLWAVEVPLGTAWLRVQLGRSEENRILLNSELLALTHGPARMDHLESPEFPNQLESLREMADTLVFWAYTGLERAALLIAELAIIGVLVASVEPGLIVLVALAFVPVLCGHRAEGALARARDAAAEPTRLRRHLLDVASDAAAAKEIRVFGLADELRARQAHADATVARLHDRAELRAGLLRAVGQLVFALAFALALYLVVDAGVSGRASVGDVVMTVSLTMQLSASLSYFAGIFNRLQAALDGAGRLLWLRATARGADADRGELAAPDRLADGIVLEDVSFTYPSGDTPSLAGVTLALPAGAVVALVGENGAGKTTLVKLLAGLHRPTRGQIVVDGTSLAAVNAVEWRRRVSAAFQDFVRFEVRARESVGIGDEPRAGDSAAVIRALERARSSDILDALPSGLDTLVGRSYADGAELSGGQWQKLALARAMMEEEPLLLLLDEPTAALDAHAEHHLFESYAEHAGAAARERGAITVLVSHRFSTVRMADLIVVMEHGRVVEQGTHERLKVAGGVYAALFEAQASAYR